MERTRLRRVRFYLGISALCSILTASICILLLMSSVFSYPSFQVIREDFEEKLDDWAVDADVPLDPNNPGSFVEWNITRSNDVAHSGEYSLKYFIDGRQDDGTIWIERKLSVKKNSRAKIKISFMFYSESESFNTIASICTYAGIRNPEAEEDFVILGSANEAEGWKNYEYTANLYTGSSEEIWVAIGITVRWETYMTYFIDDVKVEVENNPLTQVENER